MCAGAGGGGVAARGQLLLRGGPCGGGAALCLDLPLPFAFVTAFPRPAAASSLPCPRPSTDFPLPSGRESSVGQLLPVSVCNTWLFSALRSNSTTCPVSPLFPAFRCVSAVSIADEQTSRRADEQQTSSGRAADEQQTSRRATNVSLCRSADGLCDRSCSVCRRLSGAPFSAQALFATEQVPCRCLSISLPCRCLCLALFCIVTAFLPSLTFSLPRLCLSYFSALSLSVLDDVSLPCRCLCFTFLCLVAAFA